MIENYYSITCEKCQWRFQIAMSDFSHCRVQEKNMRRIGCIHCGYVILLAFYIRAFEITVEKDEFKSNEPSERVQQTYPPEPTFPNKRGIADADLSPMLEGKPR